MNILVLNCGSSSVKFQLIETDKELIEKKADKQLAKGTLERIGSESLITIEVPGRPKMKKTTLLRDHKAAVDFILKWIISPDSQLGAITSMADIHAVGHRVVHGGEKFKMSVKIDKDILDGIEDCVDLAPLHNPANLKGIHAARQILGEGVPQVAVFDTSFHSTMPDTSFLYGIPYQFYRRYKIRRYGFHGTSHRYVSYRYREFMKTEQSKVNIITLHLGNGASACAIKNGDSFITSMGFTPLEGLIMGTRAGDIDPSIIEFLMHKEGFNVSQFDTILNKQSGLLGISGLTGDMRDLLEEVEENQDRRARIAVEMFCSRVQQYIGGYYAQMGGAEAVIFTGGIGENSVAIRERICRPLGPLGLTLDKKRNKAVKPGAVATLISTDDSKLKAYVMPTNEELLIARDTLRVIKNLPRRW